MMHGESPQQSVWLTGTDNVIGYDKCATCDCQSSWVDVTAEDGAA